MFLFIIVATPVYVTLFWAIVMLTGETKNNRPRLMLGLFMLTAALLYVCHAVFFLNHQVLYLVVDSFYLLVSLSVYPLYYWYVKLLTSETQLHAWNLLHFIPAVVLSAALGIFHMIAGSEDRMLYLQEVLIAGRRGLLTDTGYPGWLAKIYLASRLVFVAQVILYAIYSSLLANRHNQRLENFYSNLEHRRLVWVKLIFISLLLTSFVSITFSIIGRETFLSSETRLAIPSVIFSVLLFILGLQGERQNLVIREMDIETDELVQPSLTIKSHELLKVRLEELMKRDRMYLVHDLKITTLCKMLNTNRTYISNLINEETGGNFNTYINRFRIEHAVELMKKNGASLLVMNHIALESGFGSSSSFIRAFKSFKGMTPWKFIQEIQNCKP
jgi:AraC-like DNA-binding protein